METPKAIQPVPPAPAPLPKPPADDAPLLPWDTAGVPVPPVPVPVPPVAVPHPRAALAKRRGRPAPAFEAVHWSIVALTLATAISILAGSFGGETSRPRELLPIVIAAAP